MRWKKLRRKIPTWKSGDLLLTCERGWWVVHFPDGMTRHIDEEVANDALAKRYAEEYIELEYLGRAYCAWERWAKLGEDEEDVWDRAQENAIDMYGTRAAADMTQAFMEAATVTAQTIADDEGFEPPDDEEFEKPC